MSVKMMALVWESALSSDEKFVALALADWADDQGRNIYPSQATVARKVGKSDRAVRETFRKLIAANILEEDPWLANEDARRTKRYRIVASALPFDTPEETSGVGSDVDCVLSPPSPEETSAPLEETSGRPEAHDRVPGSPLPTIRQRSDPDPSSTTPPTARARLRVIGSDEHPPGELPLALPGPHAQAVSATVAALEASRIVVAALFELRASVAVEAIVPNGVQREIAAWPEHLTLEDVQRIRRESDDARRNNRGGDWNWIRAVCTRVAGDRRDRRDPWARGGQADVAGRDHARAPRPRALAPPGGGRARTTFAGDGARGGFSTEPPPA